MEAIEAAEMAVLESHRAEFEAAAEELEDGINEVGEWLEGEFDELEGDFRRVNVDNLQAPQVSMITLGEELKKELVDYKQAKMQLGEAIEDKAREVEMMANDWWAANGANVTAEFE